MRWTWIFLAAMAFGGGTAIGGEADFELGACFHFAQGKGDIEANLDFAKALGLNAMRDECYWSYTETEAGKIAPPAFFETMLAAAAARDIAPMVIASYGNELYDGSAYPRSPEALAAYSRYCAELAKLGQGRIRYLQIWNEWDGGCGMAPEWHGKGDPDAYMALLKSAFPAVKAAAPETVVVAGSVCTGDVYLEELLRRGLLNYCDRVSLHTYNYPKAPEQWYRRMVGVDALLRRYSGGKMVPLLVTEMGYPTQVNAAGVSQESSGDYLARLLLLGRSLDFLHGLWWYDFEDDGLNVRENEDNFGLTKVQLAPKSAAYVMADLAELIKHGEFLGREEFPEQPDLWTMRYRMPDGEEVWAFWSGDSGKEFDLVLQNPDTPPLFQRMAGMVEVPLSWGRRIDWLDKYWSSAREETLTLVSAANRPTLVRGDLTAMKIVGVQERTLPARDAGAQPGRFPTTGGILYRESSKQPGVRMIPDERLASQGGEWSGEKDFCAEFSWRYDAEALRLQIRVMDDSPVPDAAQLNLLWQVDSLQLAMQRAADFGTERRTEMDIALLAGSPAVFLRENVEDLPPRAAPEVAVTRTATPDGVLWTLVIPWRLLGVESMAPGGLVGVSCLVNDVDADGKRNYIQFGSGIAGAKQPSAYRLLVAE